MTSPCYNQLFEGTNDAFVDDAVFREINFRDDDDSADEDFLVIEDEVGLLRLL